jgi:hypothetical protein
LGIAEADQVEVTIGTRLLRLPARVSATLVAGTVGLPAGLTGLPPLPALGWSELKRLETGKVATA